MAMTLLGIVVVTLDTALAWLVAAFGVEMLFQAARDGNLYGSGGTYGIGVVVAIVLAVAWVALGLYFALRKSPRIR